MKLIVVEEGTRSVLHLERKVIRLGRSIDNDVRLASKLVSRHHCRIEVAEDGAWVLDLGSANGTLVNGERIDRRLIGPDDEISMGGARVRLEFEDGDDEAEPLRGIPAEGPLYDGTTTEGLSAVGLVTQNSEGVRERENLRVFAKITRALVRETEEGPLLEGIVDSAVSLAGAERGFLLLFEGEPKEDEEVDLEVRVARSFDHTEIAVPASRLSTGIARQVFQTGRPVLSVDAGSDERFREMRSVEDLRLRSVMCLPIQIDKRVEGVLYVDNRLQHGAFSEEDLDLVELFADQAAIALRNARQMAELRHQNRHLLRSRQQIEGLNEQLGRKIRDRDSELAVVRAELERERGRYDYGSIVGASDGMRAVFEQLDRIIECDLPVFIHGDSGTGKELIARAIHFNGARKDKPFVSLNCAALPDSLIESELFGHTRGAFTGADRSKKGLIEQAHGGTLFLDEIGDMSAEMQKKLLRVLQEQEVRPLGSDRRVDVDVRLLSASHHDLEELARAGSFREDLFYRINVLSVSLPALRDRRDDIPLLSEALLARAAREVGRAVPVLPQDVRAALVAYDWPGNVRELENEMRRLVVLAEDVVTLDQLSPAIAKGAGRLTGPGASLPALDPAGDLRAAVARFERFAIERALERSGGNKSRAAAELGISRFALQRKLDKFSSAAPGAETAEEGEGKDKE